MSDDKVKVVKFDGKEEDDCRSWSSKKKAIATMKGWVGSLLVKIDPSIVDTTTDPDELKLLKIETKVKMYLPLA